LDIFLGSHPRLQTKCSIPIFLAETTLAYLENGQLKALGEGFELKVQHPSIWGLQWSRQNQGLFFVRIMCVVQSLARYRVSDSVRVLVSRHGPLLRFDHVPLLSVRGASVRDERAVFMV
jgi:hypothetical protein